ncbi:MAG TPA: universal stress protein [Streptosporangiaceae bacterium]|nr:universal stress protein [Streptosporangiaceae bacterium]
MYEKVLVAVDHSEVSERVLAAARDLALLSKGEVWVVHLREREVIAQLGRVPSESESEAEAAITSAVESLNAAGVRAHGEVRDTLFGHAAREIIEDARERGADVIVMGSRGRGDLTGLVLGSTAHKVIHLADRPVLVVR